MRQKVLNPEGDKPTKPSSWKVEFLDNTVYYFVIIIDIVYYPRKRTL